MDKSKSEESKNTSFHRLIFPIILILICFYIPFQLGLLGETAFSAMKLILFVLPAAVINIVLYKLTRKSAKTQQKNSILFAVILACLAFVATFCGGVLGWSSAVKLNHGIMDVCKDLCVEQRMTSSEALNEGVRLFPVMQFNLIGVYLATAINIVEDIKARKPKKK